MDERAEAQPGRGGKTYVTACFDRVAEDYAAQYGKETLGGCLLRIRHDLLLRLSEGLSPGRALDVGCGPAPLANELVRRGWSYVGVDASSRMIALAAERHCGQPATRFGLADIQRLPFADATFDLVLCIGVIDRVPDAETAIDELSRLVAPGGVLLMSFPNRLSPYAWWLGRLLYPALGWSRYLLGRNDPANDYLRHRARLWTLADATSLLRQTVGDDLDVRFYGFVPLLSPLDQLFPKLAVRSARALQPLSEGRLRQLGSGFLVKVRKPA